MSRVGVSDCLKKIYDRPLCDGVMDRRRVHNPGTVRIWWRGLGQSPRITASMSTCVLSESFNTLSRGRTINCCSKSPHGILWLVYGDVDVSKSDVETRFPHQAVWIRPLRRVGWSPVGCGSQSTVYYSSGWDLRGWGQPLHLEYKYS